MAVIEHSAPLVVEREPVWLGEAPHDAVRHVGQAFGNLVAKIVVGEIEEVGFVMTAGAGAGVDGNPNQQAFTVEQDVIVRSAAGRLDVTLEHAPLGEAVSVGSHDSPRRQRNDRAIVAIETFLEERKRTTGYSDSLVFCSDGEPRGAACS